VARRDAFLAPGSGATDKRRERVSENAALFRWVKCLPGQG
jgi:hypothetical protein